MVCSLLASRLIFLRRRFLTEKAMAAAGDGRKFKPRGIQVALQRRASAAAGTGAGAGAGTPAGATDPGEGADAIDALTGNEAGEEWEELMMGGAAWDNGEWVPTSGNAAADEDDEGTGKRTRPEGDMAGLTEEEWQLLNE